MGLVDELAEPADVVPRALAVAEEMAALPHAAYPKVKQQVRGETIAAMQRVLAGDDPLAQAGWLSGETAGAAAATLRGSS